MTLSSFIFLADSRWQRGHGYGGIQSKCGKQPVTSHSALPLCRGEHLCFMLSISTSLAPILVPCKFELEKLQQCHLATLSRVLELHSIWIMIQRTHILGSNSSDSIGFSWESSPLHAHCAMLCSHPFALGALGDTISVPVLLDDFITNHMREVSVLCLSGKNVEMTAFAQRSVLSC